MPRSSQAKKPVVTEKIAHDAANNPKRPIKFNIELNEEQKDAKRKILNNAITVLTGEAGSGKTLVAVITALDQLFKKEIKKIFITRPLVTREEIGFLPGDIGAKLDPFLIPIYDNLSKCYDDPNKIQKMLESKQIDIAPIAYMRGRTFEDAILIIDEAQNIDDESMKMCLTRIGNNGRIIICGDNKQIDLKKKDLSGFDFICWLVKKHESENNGMAYKFLESNHRHPIVKLILEEYTIREADKARDRENKKQLLND